MRICSSLYNENCGQIGTMETAEKVSGTAAARMKNRRANIAVRMGEENGRGKSGGISRCFQCPVFQVLGGEHGVG